MYSSLLELELIGNSAGESGGGIFLFDGANPPLGGHVWLAPGVSQAGHRRADTIAAGSPEAQRGSSMFGLLPRNLEFFDCFDKAAANALRTAELLAEFSAADGDDRLELVGAIKEKEHVGDTLTHETLDRLQRTYLTPIDRDDIYALTKAIDDIVDDIDAVAQRIMFYKIRAITRSFQSQCDVLVKATRLMADAVAALRNLKKSKRSSGPQIEELIIAVHEAENEGDDIHHRFLGELFDCGFDAFDVIKWKELYEIVESAIDCCEDVANIVHGIAIKTA